MRANPVETLKKFRDVKEARNGMYVDTYNDYVKMAVGGASKNNVDEVCSIDLVTGGDGCPGAGKRRRARNKAQRQARRSQRRANRRFRGGRRY